ncbi:MAG: stage III sporulation AC/AD family protein [Lachnospiraceae bacterium]|nr:stage III sporulation AC/AD family protein [Lachnospiraceae bacterium]
MNMMKIGILGIVGALIGIQFKSQKQEYSMYIGFAVCIIIFSYGVQCLESVLNTIFEWKELLGTSASYIGVLIKITGITYICEFCAGICKEAGFSAVAGQIEIAGKLSVLLSGMPILVALIETIQGFLQ